MQKYSKHMNEQKKQNNDHCNPDTPPKPHDEPFRPCMLGEHISKFETVLFHDHFGINQLLELFSSTIIEFHRIPFMYELYMIGTDQIPISSSSNASPFFT